MQDGGDMIKPHVSKWKKDLNPCHQQKDGNCQHLLCFMPAIVQHLEFLKKQDGKKFSKTEKMNAYLWYLLNELNNAQAEQVIEY